MSATSNTRSVVLDWVKERGLLLITILGLALYIILSIPATIFYHRLGTTPAEVGITYTSLLSGSVFGVLIIVILLILIFLYAAVYLAYVEDALRDLKSLQEDPDPNKRNRELTDAEFELRLDNWRSNYLKFSESWNSGMPAMTMDDEAHHYRRVRELLVLGVRSPDEASELETLKSELDTLKAGRKTSRIILTFNLTKQWMKLRGRFLVVIVSTVTLLVILPALAFVQADQIMNGKPYSGSRFGVFEYQAEPVTIKPASQLEAPNVKPWVGQRLFLLGQNSQDIILYSPAQHMTIRLPSTTVIVTSFP